MLISPLLQFMMQSHPPQYITKLPKKIGLPKMAGGLGSPPILRAFTPLGLRLISFLKNWEIRYKLVNHSSISFSFSCWFVNVIRTNVTFYKVHTQFTITKVCIQITTNQSFGIVLGSKIIIVFLELSDYVRGVLASDLYAMQRIASQLMYILQVQFYYQNGCQYCDARAVNYHLKSCQDE